MINAVLLALVVGAPTRLVVGIDAEDLRRAQDEPSVSALVEQLGATRVRTLARAVVIDVESAEEAQAVLRKRRDVRFVERDDPFPIELRQALNDPLYADQWHLHRTEAAHDEAQINAEAAWAVTRGQDVGGTPVLIAIFDDGFDLAHPDLQGAWQLPGRDFSSETVDDDPTPGARDVHGTKTAGVIAARADNGVGVAGVCPSCRLLPVRLIGAGGPPGLYTTGSEVAAAIEWAVDKGAAVINNSWGPPDGNPFDPLHPVESWPLPSVIADALSYAATEGRSGLGTIVTWSAGNGSELATYDGFASDPRVIAVGSINSLAQRSYYSDFGPTVDLVAPSSGSDEMPKIVTTDISGAGGDDPDDYNRTYGGTSASSAMVAGAAGLVLAAFPHLSAAQVTEALYASAFPVDTARGQYTNGRSPLYGYGRVDIAAALAFASGYHTEHTFWLEVCGNNRDDNGDGQIDDPDSCTSCFPDHSKELCDGRDNNCDGSADEYFVCERTERPVCAPCTTSAQCADSMLCRTSPSFPGTWCFESCESVGDCPGGFACNGEVCLLETSAETLDCFDLLRCTQKERCDSLDNDCNGVIDDIDLQGLEARVAGDGCKGRGVCEASIASCIDGRWACEYDESFQENETRCDSLDNDCDGTVDEDCHVDMDDGCLCSTRSSRSGSWLAWLLVGAALSRAGGRRWRSNAAPISAKHWAANGRHERAARQ